MNRMIIDCNSTTERLFGYKKEELINRNFIELEIFEPEFLPLINQRYKFLLRGAIPESMEIKAYKKNGKSIWIKLQGSLVKFKDVNIIQLTIQDINKQKQSDKKLREVWEQYRLLIEHAPLGIFSADKEGNIKIINPPLLKMLVSPTAEATKQINLLTFPLLRKTGISAAIEYCIERGESLSNEFLYRSKWGKEIYARLFLDPIRDPSNQISGVQAIVEDITNWKRVEKELRENEEKYRCLFHHSNDGIIIHNLEGDIIDVNQKVLDQFKYTKSEILMLKIHQLHPIEEIDKAAKLFKEIFKKRLVKFEIRFKKKNSEIFLAEVSTSLFSIGEKEVIQGIIRDISERKQAEQKLIESEEKYRLISENANDLIFIVNMNIITEYINEEVFKKLLGYSKDDVIGKSALNFVHPEDIEKIMKLIRNGLKVGEGMGELRCIDKNNLYHWLELRGKTFIDRDGKTKGLFIARDITERKKAEQKLIESEEKYRHLFENTPVSIMLVDSKRQIVDCNPSTEKLLEYEKKELIGKRFENFSIDLQKFLPILFEPVDTILKVEPSTPVEVQLYKKDNSLIWTQLQSSLIKVGSETLNQVIIQDITHRKKSENLIKEEIIKLKELDQIRKDLITSVSHELKTPLMNICGGSELLLSMFKENLGKEELEIIELIEKGGERLKFLINNLLDISRIEYKKLKLEKQLNDLSQMIKECSNEFKYLIKERKIILSLDLPEVLYLNIDKIRIEQVISNSLSNAIKNTPPNGKIKVILQKTEKWANISVSDTGIGLNIEELKKIFTRFGKIERYGKDLEYLDIKGAGLGLYISKEIVKLHGGHIWAESKGRNKGSVFKIKLPIY